MYLVTRKKLEKIERMKFPAESFEKFSNIDHPLYNEYKDRKHEEWHDRGYNNAIEDIIRIIMLF